MTARKRVLKFAQSCGYKGDELVDNLTVLPHNRAYSCPLAAAINTILPAGYICLVAPTGGYWPNRETIKDAQYAMCIYGKHHNYSAHWKLPYRIARALAQFDIQFNEHRRSAVYA